MHKNKGVVPELISEISRRHGIELSEQQLIEFDEFRLNNSGVVPYANEPSPIVAGRGFFGFVGGILGIAAAAIFTGGLTLPIASLAFAIGSTVFSLLGSLLFRPKRPEEESFAPLATISSGAPLAKIGDVSPIVYGRRDRLNLTGGVRVENPLLIYSEVRARDGLQELVLVYLLSKGELEEISVDPADLLLNDQPINDVLLDSEYQIVFTLGKPDETREIVAYSSQTIEPTISNQVGGRLSTRQEAIASVSENKITFESEDSLSSLSPADRLVIPGDDEEDPFRLVARNRTAKTATFSRDVSNGNLFSVLSATYQTTRGVDRLTINLRVTLWERDEDGDYLEKAAVFDLFIYVNGSARQLIGTFACRGRNPNGSVRGFELRNLGESQVKVEMIPRLSPSGTIYVIGETGPYRVQTIGGFDVAFQEEENLSGAERATYTNIKKKSQYSFEQTYPIQITSVNEIILDGAKSYPGFSVFKLTIQANERISREPRTSFFIPKGRKVRNLLASREASADGTSVLHSATENFVTQVNPVQVGDSVLNLETGVISAVTAVQAQRLTLDSGNFDAGDRYLVYRVQSSCFLSDVAVDLLSDDEVSAALDIDPVEALDLSSFVEARRHHYANGIFWDDTVSERQPFAQWFSSQCAFVLSLPVTLAGQLGIIPEKDEDPVALYTVANMIEGSSYQEGWQPINEAPFNTVVVQFRDGSDRSSQEITLTAQLDGTTAPNEQVIEARCIKSLAHARAFAALTLQGFTHQNKNFSWGTDIQGVDSYPGAAVLVGSPAIRYNSASSGFVSEVDGAQFKTSLPITGNFITVENDGGLIQNLAVTVNGEWVRAAGYNSPVVGDRFIAGSTTDEHRKVRISRQSANIQDNQVELEAVLLPSILFTEDGLTIENDLISGTLKWAFEGSECFESYEGEFDTEAECAVAAQGQWGYNEVTQACEQSQSSGQHATLAICNGIWSAGHIDCPLGATAPLTANTSGILYKLGSGANPQDISLRLRYFDGFGEKSLASLTDRQLTESLIAVSSNETDQQYVILDLTNRGENGAIVQVGAKIRAWATGGNVEVFTSPSLPRSILPDKYTENEGWTSLGTQTFASDTALDWTSTQDFSFVRLVFTENGTTEYALRGIDIYDGNVILAKSTYSAIAIVTQDPWVEDAPSSPTGDVTVTAEIPDVCGSFTITIELYDGATLVGGPEFYAGPFVAGNTQSHTFTGLSDTPYNAVITLGVL